MNSAKRMMRTIFLSAFLLVFGNLTLMAQNVNINLMEGTINEVSVCECPLDSITEMLGRPSSLTNNPLIGPILKYHKLGLEIWFRPKSKDNELGVSTYAKPDLKQGAYMFMIFLSRKWDKDASEFFMPNNIVLIPSLNGNLKNKDIENQFADYITNIQTAEEAKAQSKKIFKEFYSPPEGGFMYSVTTKFSGYSLTFLHEDVTKFLEKLTIRCETE